MLLPHPKKSKDANENPLGRYYSNDLHYNLHEEFPCKYKISL